MINPPIKKSFVGNDVKALFRGWRFSGWVGYVSPKYQKILCSRNRIEDYGACLVHTVSVSLVKNTSLTGAGGTITCASSFVTAGKSLDSIHPHCTKDCSIRINHHMSAEHTLSIVLVKLKVFRSEPCVPVGLFDELATCEFHDTGDSIQNPPIVHNPVGRMAAKMFKYHRELPSVVELIMDLLRKVCGGRHHRQTSTGKIRANFRVSKQQRGVCGA